MTDRVNRYYTTPVDPSFARHMIEGIGLTSEQQSIVRQMRSTIGNTQYFADMAGMDTKKFSRVLGSIHRREMDELLRLAQIGYKTEQSSN